MKNSIDKRNFLCYRYRWAFIGCSAAGNSDKDIPVTAEDKREAKKKAQKPPSFTPHILRLTKLINERVRNINLPHY